MRSRSTRCRTRGLPARPAELVPALLEVLDGLASDEPGGVLAHAADAGDGEHVEVGLLPLAGSHPLPVLVGMEAPPRWRALGAGVAGTARRLDAPGEPARPVRVVVVVGHDGTSTSRVRTGGGPPEDQDGPVEGLVADALRRVFRLATPPPACTTEAYWAARWVDRVAAAWNDPARRGGLRSWERIEALHPARATSPAGDLARAAADHAARWTWQRLVREGDPFIGDGDRTPLGWFDAGSLSRCAELLLPPVEEVLADLVPLLEPAVAGRLRAAVADLRGPR